jgi:hypothetical protein
MQSFSKIFGSSLFRLGKTLCDESRKGNYKRDKRDERDSRAQRVNALKDSWAW